MVSWTSEKRKCDYCGKEFMAKSPNHIYCCAKCREKGQAKKQKERQTAPVSANMQKIMDMVRDNPNYAQIVREMEKCGRS